MKKLVFTLLLVSCIVFVTSCDSTQNKDSSKSKSEYPRGVNDKEAQIFARTLFHNAELGNANFSLKSGTLGSGGFVSVGSVDWKNQIVGIKVGLVNDQQVDLAAITNQDGVYESVLDLNQSLIDKGYGSYYFVKRNFDVNNYGVDSLSQFILKLGAIAPDNPILIKQNGAKIVGVENVRGVKTFKFQNKESVTYYVAQDETLMRVEADIKGFKDKITIDLSGQTQAAIELPDQNDVINIENIKDFYSTIRPKF